MIFKKTINISQKVNWLNELFENNSDNMQLML